MQRIPPRYQLPLIAGVSVVVVLLVAGAVLFTGRLAPSPSPTASTSAPSTSSSANTSTPESAVRAFFEAFGRARRDGDTSIVLPFVTSDDSAAFLSVKGLIDGQTQLGRGAVITSQTFENMTAEASGDTATVTFTFVEAGYNIDLDTGEPLESPMVLPPFVITAELMRVDGEWLVDSYVSRG